MTKCRNCNLQKDFLSPGGWCDDCRSTLPDPKGSTKSRKFAEFLGKRKPTPKVSTSPVGRDLTKMSMIELSHYRDILKDWIKKNDTHPRFEEGLKKLEAVYEEMRNRGVVNVDA